MTPSETEIRERAEAATPGPWSIDSTLRAMTAIDEAWAEVEQAGAAPGSIAVWMRGPLWRAGGTVHGQPERPDRHFEGSGETPGAALRALAALLRETEPGVG